MKVTGYLATIIALLCISYANADIYMHNPPGSNNRNRERNDNRNNANRLFDSQNNGKGGYPWRGNRELQSSADPMEYYEGSILRTEWTAQHACGTNPNTHCSVVIQYACEDTLPGLRDGYPTGPLVDSDNNNDNEIKYLQASFQRNNEAGTNTISEETKDDVEYGQHETFEMYTNCQTRERNKGLYTADRKLNGNSAKYTRQNPNGNRRGFECPEERDYYPYWGPTPFRDVAVLTSNATWCAVYEAQSQNAISKWHCEMTEAQRQNAENKLIPIDETKCGQYGGTWTETKPFADSMICQEHEFSRDNHLGNVLNDETGQPETAHYDWTLPMLDDVGLADGSQCVVRIRYNISTEDYPSMRGFYPDDTEILDARFNCPRVNTGPDQGGENAVADAADPNAACANKLTKDAAGNVVLRPRYNRPYVNVFSDSEEVEAGQSGTPDISIAINTDQSSRTFQDRSFVFKIKKRDSNSGSGKIWNLNTRGKRGNIVQAYPAVEYDFVPSRLTVDKKDSIHFQFHFSDFNTNRNPNNAEGWRYSDRVNMMEVEDGAHSFPAVASQSKFFKDVAEVKKFAFIGTLEAVQQKGLACKPFKAGQKNEQNDPLNCGKMNAAPARFDGGVKSMDMARDTYRFVSTRNNNFSNRSQKMEITITGFSAGEIAGIVVGSVGGIALLGAGTLFFVKKGGLKMPGRA